MIRDQCQIDHCYTIVIPSIKNISHLALEDTNYKSHGRYVYILTLREISIQRETCMLTEI